MEAAPHFLQINIVLLSAVLPAQVAEGLNDTAENLMAAIASDEPEVSPSTLYATACILEGAPFINGSPQNTFVPGLIELAVQNNVLIGGDDFKSGQVRQQAATVQAGSPSHGACLPTEPPRGVFVHAQLPCMCCDTSTHHF